ncbi:hypothetical protein KUTeg_021390 [Tegillarca granosa]|uniref:DDE Tnp4 domain-containing protein n=1 Tax=Tegillarca granosa TaxID=220873 RepID=A0ABQ9EAM1_TEGGR|nr:hypothetical protein KUTeg_021390 [Tegillarca granosa]
MYVKNCFLLDQNKNFMWRVLTQRTTVIEYLMQVPGHSRCLIDSGFASIKKLYRRSNRDSIEQLQKVVEKSAGSNTAKIDNASEALPEVIYPAGLSRDRQQYLYSSVRPYVRSAYKDITCPSPVEEEI